MGRPLRNRAPVRATAIAFACTDDFRARVEAVARSKGLSVAAYVRDVLEAAIAPPAKEPAPVTRPTPPMPRARPVRATTRWCTPREDSLRSKEG